MWWFGWFQLFLLSQLLFETTSSGDPTCPFETRTSADIIDCSGYAQRHGKLKLKGIQLVNSVGDPVQLQGSSSFGLQYYPDCVTKESISYLVRNWGITVFRAAVSLSDTGYTTNPTYFDTFVNNIVDWCEELGIYVIIDWHLLDPGDPNFYLTSRGAHTGTAIDFWKKMAVLYKSRTHVIYEIANEPNGVPWNVTLDYHNAVIYEIRNIDPDTVIIAGTGHFSQDLDLAYQQPVKYPHNVLYAFHFYSSSHGYLFPMFQQYSLLLPIFVSEFGLNDFTCTGELNDEVTDQYLTIFAGSNTTPAISWTIWSWSDKDETCSALLPDACSTRSWDSLTCTGLYMANYMKEANINGSYGCLHSTTTYPTGTPTVHPTKTPEPETLSNTQIITHFLTIYGSIAAGFVLLGSLLYYLQIIYYPRRPQDKTHIPDEDVITRLSRSASQWRKSTLRYAPTPNAANATSATTTTPVLMTSLSSATAAAASSSSSSSSSSFRGNYFSEGGASSHHRGLAPVDVNENDHDLEQDEEKYESDMVITNSDIHLRHSSQFVVTNPLKDRNSS